jgi:hypothetical protein
MHTKIVISSLIAATFIFSSCENYRARRLGGTMTVELEPGEKLVSVTWKDESLFYLTEPMEVGYIPKIKMFKEKSNYGIQETTVKFIESK